MSQEQKIQELQMLEHHLQQIVLQKQAFQMEVTETQSALKEIEKSGEEIFKIIGQLMLKADKKETIEELNNKEKILSLRINTLEKQENSLSEKLEKAKEEFTKSMKK